MGRRFAIMEIVTIFATVMRKLSFHCHSDYELHIERSGFVIAPVDKEVNLDISF